MQTKDSIFWSWDQTRVNTHQPTQCKGTSWTSSLYPWQTRGSCWVSGAPRLKRYHEFLTLGWKDLNTVKGDGCVWVGWSCFFDGPTSNISSPTAETSTPRVHRVTALPDVTLTPGGASECRAWCRWGAMGLNSPVDTAWQPWHSRSTQVNKKCVWFLTLCDWMTLQGVSAWILPIITTSSTDDSSCPGGSCTRSQVRHVFFLVSTPLHLHTETWSSRSFDKYSQTSKESLRSRPSSQFFALWCWAGAGGNNCY